jgi:membrane-associated phospholipid phosphatase
MRTPPPAATLPGMNNDRYAMAQAIYERTMWRLRVGIRLLAVALLTLVARCVIDGLNIADVIAGTVIALLLIAAVGLWRQGRRVRPDADARHTGSDHDNSAPTPGMTCVP